MGFFIACPVKRVFKTHSSCKLTLSLAETIWVELCTCIIRYLFTHERGPIQTSPVDKILAHTVFVASNDILQEELGQESLFEKKYGSQWKEFMKSFDQGVLQIGYQPLSKEYDALGVDCNEYLVRAQSKISNLTDYLLIKLQGQARFIHDLYINR
jgi:hypothetical protein